MNITKIDVAWNFLATFLKTASSVILLPIILKLLSTQDIGLWTIFVSIGSTITILDFGFAPSFSRNITFIFSGINKLSKEGYAHQHVSEEINYGLLKATLRAMHYFYSRISIAIFLILITGGTWYVKSLISSDYHGNITNVYIAWGIFVAIISFNMYTDYLESLLIGKGMIKVSKQITIVAQLVYLIIAAVLLFKGYGLIGLFASQLVSTLIIRYFSYKNFYTATIKNHLKNALVEVDYLTIIKTIFPNAIKGGINSLGSIFIYRAPIIIGSVFLSLKEIASYGLTRQIFDILYLIASTYSITYFPQLSSNWIKGKILENQKLYVTSILITILIYCTSCVGLYLFANPFLSLLGSHTLLISGVPLMVMMINYFFTLIHGQSVPVIVSKNYLPLYYVGFIGGLFVMLLSFVFLKYFDLNVLGLVLAPTIIYLLYENWKWPYLAFKELNLNVAGFINIVKQVIRETRLFIKV